MSRREAGWSGGTSKSNIRAAGATVQPWRISDIRTTIKATPKNIAASGSPARTGLIARKIGTAPRKPTQEMKAISGAVDRKGSKHSATTTGGTATSRSPAMTNQGGSSATKAI